MTHQQRLAALSAQLSTQRINPVLALAKGLGIAVLGFIFCAGLIVVVVPIGANVWNWAAVQLAGIDRWLWLDATTGYQLSAAFELSLMLGLVWLARHWILWAVTWSMAKIEGASHAFLKSRKVEAPAEIAGGENGAA